MPMKTLLSTSQSSVVSSPRRPLVGLVLAALLSMGGGACMLSVEAEVPDVEVTQHDIAFEGVPFGASLGDVSTGKSFTQERPLDLPKALDSTVQAVKIELHAKTGIKDFAFLRALRITMAPTGGTTPAVELINYEKKDGAVIGATLSIPSKNPVNILEQWKADSAIFNVEVAGTLPSEAWTIDMSVHFSGKVSYKY
jgi:hypothetical protein